MSYRRLIPLLLVFMLCAGCGGDGASSTASAASAESSSAPPAVGLPDSLDGGEWSWESPALNRERQELQEAAYASPASSAPATLQTFWELSLEVPDSMTIERHDSYVVLYEEAERDRWFALLTKLPNGPDGRQALQDYAEALFLGQPVEELALAETSAASSHSSGVATRYSVSAADGSGSSSMSSAASHSSGVATRYSASAADGSEAAESPCRMEVVTFSYPDWVYSIAVVCGAEDGPPVAMLNTLYKNARVA